MRLAIIGLGRMGANIARRLMRGGHEVVAYNRHPEPVELIAREGAIAASSLEDVVSKLESPRIFWVMLPAGDPTESTIATLLGLASPGDVVIDGGNSFYKDDIRLAKTCREHGIDYVDVGTSGGIWGLERGFSLFIDKLALFFLPHQKRSGHFAVFVLADGFLRAWEDVFFFLFNLHHLVEFRQ